MRPFNLEAALAGAAVVTRDGREVKDLAYLPNRDNEYKVIGLIEGRLATWTKAGHTYVGSQEHSSDLFMASVKRVVWVNLYDNLLSHYFSTQTQADSYALHDRLGDRAWPLEIEE